MGDRAGRFVLTSQNPGSDLLHGSLGDGQIPAGEEHGGSKPQSSGEGLEDPAKLLQLQVLPAGGFEGAGNG